MGGCVNMPKRSGVFLFQKRKGTWKIQSDTFLWRDTALGCKCLCLKSRKMLSWDLRAYATIVLPVVCVCPGQHFSRTTFPTILLSHLMTRNDWGQPKPQGYHTDWSSQHLHACLQYKKMLTLHQAFTKKTREPARDSKRKQDTGARCCCGTLSSFTGSSAWVGLRCCCSAHVWTILIYLNITWSRKTQPDVAGYWVTGYSIAIPTSPRTDIYFLTPPHLHPRVFSEQTMLSTACLLTTSSPLFQLPQGWCCLLETGSTLGGMANKGYGEDKSPLDQKKQTLNSQQKFRPEWFGVISALWGVKGL